MNLIRPFAGLRPAPGREQEVIAPPYDVLDSNEARQRAAGKPWSFLHVSKAEIDLPVGTDPYSPAVYAKAKENFDRMLAEGVLKRDPEPVYYLYRLTMGRHTQIGVVAAASVAAYEAGHIRRHEFTRPDKEDDRVRQIDALNAQTGPVFLTYRRSAEVDALVARATAVAPAIDLSADDGVRHSMWVVREKAIVDPFTRAFDAVGRLYIADGHHRSAAAARVAVARRAASAKHSANAADEYFLAVAFPDNQVQIFDYNRLVKDLNGLSSEALLARVGEVFEITPVSAPLKPASAGEFGMFLQRQWYRLRIRGHIAAGVAPADPVRRLDVSLLQDNLLGPILGIGDPRRDKRVDFVGGIRGLGELERRVNSGEMAAAFSLFPTSLADLMGVADAGEVMPPKSTWFEPKLADGLVSHVLE